jgi:hypothetical protein
MLPIVDSEPLIEQNLHVLKTLPYLSHLQPVMLKYNQLLQQSSHLQHSASMIAENYQVPVDNANSNSNVQLKAQVVQGSHGGLTLKTELFELPELGGNKAKDSIASKQFIKLLMKWWVPTPFLCKDLRIPGWITHSKSKVPRVMAKPGLL